MIIFKNELKKAVSSRLFHINIILVIIMAIMHAYFAIKNYRINAIPIIETIKSGNIHSNPMLQDYSTYNLWIGAPNKSFFKTILLYILPLSASISYGWSYYKKKKIDSIGQYKTSIYSITRYLIAFIVSGTIMVIPFIVNFLTISMFVPLIKPDSVYDIYYGVFSSHFLGNLFYSAPLIYIGSFILLAFIYGGLIGCLSYSFTSIYHNHIVAIAITYILFFIIQWKNKKIASIIASDEVNLSPISFLSSAQDTFLNIKVYLIEIIIMFMCSFAVIIYYRILKRKGEKNEK